MSGAFKISSQKGDLPVPKKQLAEIFSSYSAETNETVLRELRSLGIFMKVDDENGRGQARNPKWLMAYQFGWLAKAHSIVPSNIPRPMVLFEAGQRVGYLTEFLHMDYLMDGKLSCMQFYEKIIAQFPEVLGALHGSRMTHNDLMGNSFVRRDLGELILIDPMHSAGDGASLKTRKGWDTWCMEFIFERLDNYVAVNSRRVAAEITFWHLITGGLTGSAKKLLGAEAIRKAVAKDLNGMENTHVDTKKAALLVGNNEIGKLEIMLQESQRK